MFEVTKLEQFQGKTKSKIFIEKIEVREKEKAVHFFLYIDVLPSPEELRAIEPLFQKYFESFTKLEQYCSSYGIRYKQDPEEQDYLAYYPFVLECSNTHGVLNHCAYTYQNKTFEFTIVNESKQIIEGFDKLVTLYHRFGFVDVKIIHRLADKEKIAQEQKRLEAENKKQMTQNVKLAEEEQKRAEEINTKVKNNKPYRAPSLDDHIPPMPLNKVPVTNVELDDFIRDYGHDLITVEGEIFDIVYNKIPSRGSWAEREFFEIRITDYDESLLIKKFVRGEADKEALQQLKIGDIIKAQGNMRFDIYSEREVILQANSWRFVESAAQKEIEDVAVEKRVELHIHTKMSALDGLSDAVEYIEQAKKWGHKAIAFTDHNGVYAIPDIAKAAKKAGILPIYGVESSFVNDEKFRITFTNSDIPLNEATFVVFDIETTGLSNQHDRITEIGAVKIQHGQVISNFETFVNPEMPISDFIQSKTNITNEMVANAPKIQEALKDFLAYIDGCILVAQNASFDIGFIYENMKRCGFQINKEFDVIDTLQLARNFYFEELKTFNLKSLAKLFKVKQESYHRANDDARVTGEIFLKMLMNLFQEKIYNYNEINSTIRREHVYKYVFPSHVTILCKNQVGYKNMFEMVSDSLTTHFHREGRLLKSVLDQYREGVLVGSSCVKGEVFETALNRSYEELLEVVSYYDYLEVQPPSGYQHLIETLPNGKVVIEETIKRIIQAGKEKNILVVATGDVHYLTKELREYRTIYIQTPQIGGGRHHLAEYETKPHQHFRTTDAMLAEFGFLGPVLAHEIVVQNTNKIADMIEPIQAFPKDLFSPRDDEFIDSLGISSIEQEVTRLVYEEAKRQYGDPLPQLVLDRVEKEMNSIITNKFSAVYFMSYLLVKKSNEDGYIVGSRGSVGSSLVATLMRITEVNPLPPHFKCPKCQFTSFKMNKEEKEKYGLKRNELVLQLLLETVESGYDLVDAFCPECGTLLHKDGQDIPFETFLGFEGDKVPDIDLNFSSVYQPIAHEYVRQLMGPEHAFRSGTITTAAVNTAFGYVKGYFEDRGIKKRNVEVKRRAMKLEGVRRSTGQHPGGIIVVPSHMSITDVTPIQYPADKIDNEWRTTHFDYHKFEDNLLKLDILGHDDPTTVRFLFDYVEAHPDEFPFSTPEEIPLDDPEVYKMYYETAVLGLKKEDIMSDVATVGLPEFGTRFTRQMLIETLPKTFAELVKISGLSHGTNVWANNSQLLVNGKTDFGALSFSDVIGCRDDIMVFLMKQGLPPKDAFDIMEFVRKGKFAKGNPADLAKWEKFKGILHDYNIPEWYIWSCERIEYMFPKAHAVAYVIMAMRIAWFKLYRPILFYSAFFSVRAAQFEPETLLGGAESILKRIREIESIPKPSVKEDDLLTMFYVALEMVKRNFRFLNVDIRYSSATTFEIEGDALRLPFGSIEGLGESVAQDIVQKRKEKQFTSLQDIQERTRINKTIFEKMRALGSFGDIMEEEELLEQGLFAL